MRLTVDLHFSFSHNGKGVRNQRSNVSGRSTLDKLREEYARKPGVGKAALKWAERFTCILLLVCAAALTMIHLPWCQTRLLTSLARRVESETEVRVRCKGFWWFPLFGVHVRQLEVDAGGRNVLSCREAVLDLAFSFNKPWVVLESLTLRSPTLHLEKIQGSFMAFGNTPRRADPTDPSDTVRRRTERTVWPTRPRMLNVRIHSGMITADQNGLRVLDIKGMDGSLALKMDGEVKAPFLNLDSFTIHD
jgi:hypothetical protein